MTEYLTEQEQIQQIKSWLKQYGLTILTGIIFAILVSCGWRYYQEYKNRVLIQASAIYDEMLSLRAQNNVDGSAVHAKKLISNYAKTPYADMAAFLLARNAILKKDYDGAITQLNWIIDHSKNLSIQQIARIRIAKIQINNTQSKDALKTLEKVSDKNFLGLINEIKGDAYLALGDKNAAKQSYELALHELPNAEVNRPILEMKYDNLADVAAKG